MRRSIEATRYPPLVAATPVLAAAAAVAAVVPDAGEPAVGLGVLVAVAPMLLVACVADEEAAVPASLGLGGVATEATFPFEVSSERKDAAFGAWMAAAARAPSTRRAVRKPTPSGAGMTIPWAAAIRSMR
jgi:hypothetical protein